MTTAMLERRLAKLEARELARRPSPTQCTLPPLSPDAIRVVLKMLIEMGALIPPPAGVPDRWQELRVALFGSNSLASDGDQEVME